MQDTIAHIRQFPESGHVPVELEGFGDDRYRQALSGKNRIIYQLRNETIFIHLVIDARRDLQALLQRIVLRLM
ncbi:plasmid stabilization protein [Paraburkholderia dinghuensis]|uniref:Plasmid stabilization protein n=1 Tax=Paraburkholderia dinghuensis TaxID=2305225 RepID=A0A3N6MHT0_9BURK|nr:plasmid stabilization protein [Paraburkholderia dinghuensis]